LPGSCFTIWAILPALFVWVVFEIGSHFVPRLSWTVILLFVLPHIAGMTGTCQRAQPLVKMEVSWTFCLSLLWTTILLDLYLLSS
jgi:hypothetical protein